MNERSCREERKVLCREERKVLCREERKVLCREERKVLWLEERSGERLYVALLRDCSGCFFALTLLCPFFWALLAVAVQTPSKFKISATINSGKPHRNFHQSFTVFHVRLTKTPCFLLYCLL